MLDAVINDLVNGFALIGNALSGLLIAVFSLFGVEMPDWGARLTLLGVSALLVWRLQKMLPKLILIGVCIVAASILVGLL